MIGALKKYFDDFSMSARIKPAITACFPLLVIALYKGVLEHDWSEAGLTFFLAIILISFASYVVRELGKTYEERMINKLSSLPSTMILRFSDKRISPITKKRYHCWLNSRMDGIQMPLSLEEEEADPQSDNKYANAVDFLRINANSHREEFPRVYQELKKYNYWRNLYGCKWYALIAYSIIVAREIFVINSFVLKEVFVAPFPKYGVFLGVLIWSVIFCSVVTKKTVERNAFDYARALVETVEILSQQNN